jgi:hypothetical protein
LGFVAVAGIIVVVIVVFARVQVPDMKLANQTSENKWEVKTSR